MSTLANTFRVAIFDDFFEDFLEVIPFSPSSLELLYRYDKL